MGTVLLASFGLAGSVALLCKVVPPRGGTKGLLLSISFLYKKMIYNYYFFGLAKRNNNFFADGSFLNEAIKALEMKILETGLKVMKKDILYDLVLIINSKCSI